MVGGIARRRQTLATAHSHIVLLRETGRGHYAQPRGGIEDIIQGALELRREIGEVRLGADDSAHHRGEVDVVVDVAEVWWQDADIVIDP